MAGLTSLSTKINIKDEPHHLAYITKEEGDILKSMGAVGKPMQGTKGIPAYIGVGDAPGLAEDYGPDGDMYGGHFSMVDDFSRDDEQLGYNNPAWDKAMREARENIDILSTERALTPEETSYVMGNTLAEQFGLSTRDPDLSAHQFEELYHMGFIPYSKLQEELDAMSTAELDEAVRQGAITFNEKLQAGYADKVDAEAWSQDMAAARDLTDYYKSKDYDVGITIGPEGHWSYSGPDAALAAASEMGKGFSDLASLTGKGAAAMALGAAQGLSGAAIEAAYPGSTPLGGLLAALQRDDMLNLSKVALGPEIKTEQQYTDYLDPTIPKEVSAQARREAEPDYVSPSVLAEQHRDAIAQAQREEVFFEEDAFDQDEVRKVKAPREPTPPVVPEAKTARQMLKERVGFTPSGDQGGLISMPTFVEWLDDNPEYEDLPPHLQSAAYRKQIGKSTGKYAYDPTQSMAPEGAGYGLASLQASYPDISRDRLLEMMGYTSNIG